MIRGEAKPMILFSVLLTALGVILSTLGGLVYFGGRAAARGVSEVLPHVDLVLGEPSAAIGIGIVLIVLGIVSCPRHTL